MLCDGMKDFVGFKRGIFIAVDCFIFLGSRSCLQFVLCITLTMIQGIPVHSTTRKFRLLKILINILFRDSQILYN